jgi:hypothetical protein
MGLFHVLLNDHSFDGGEKLGIVSPYVDSDLKMDGMSMF